MVDEAVCRPLVQVTTVNTIAITATTTKPVRIAPPNSLSCQFGFCRVSYQRKQNGGEKVPALPSAKKQCVGRPEGMLMHIQMSDVST